LPHDGEWGLGHLPQMNKKRAIIYTLVFAVLALLVYLQFRTWRNFDWDKFFAQAKQLNLPHLSIAIGTIYFTYFLRALRWKIFLRPVRKDASVLRSLSPTILGFAGLAMLGRPGELIRPYLIARNEGLSFSSQMAAWTVERIFDIGGFTVLLVCAIFLPGTALHDIPKYHAVELFGCLFVALAIGTAFVAILTAKYGETISVWVERRFAHLASNLGHRIAQRLREFHRGLDTIHDPRAFLEICGVSIGMWSCIAFSYLEVVRAYGSPLRLMTFSKIFPLMGTSMVGSLIQLPGVGGGSQLATISTLQKIFGVPQELAASCGILLWLVTFMSVIPAGLFLAHHQRLSLRELSEESQQAESNEKLS
jgi:uncharacterized protein (TIRG00374 family)